MGFGIPGRVMLPNNNICLVLERIIPCENWGNCIAKWDNYPRNAMDNPECASCKKWCHKLEVRPCNIGHQVAQIRGMSRVCWPLKFQLE